MSDRSDAPAREKMLLGAHVAGAAIENSMLGAAHALANPLTALAGVVHGPAVGMMLPHVVRFNSSDGQRPYADLMDDPRTGPADRIAARRGRPAADVSPTPACRRSCCPTWRRWPPSSGPRRSIPGKVGEAELAEIYRMAIA